MWDFTPSYPVRLCGINLRHISPVVWDWTEGVIPYLTEALVSDLAMDLYMHTSFKLWIAEYYAPQVYPRYQSAKFKKLFGDSPFQFFPTNWASFFEERGWVKMEMRYLYDEGERLDRKFLLPLWAKFLKFIIGAQKILQSTRVSAYIVYEKKNPI